MTHAIVNRCRLALCLWVASLWAVAVPAAESRIVRAGDEQIVLLGQHQQIPFDEIKAFAIARTAQRLLQSCTTATPIRSIPAVSYKGVRIVRPGGKVTEAHIFPDSASSYMVKIYTREGGTTTLHGKYTDYAYQLISMLEMKN